VNTWLAGGHAIMNAHWADADWAGDEGRCWVCGCSGIDMV
jgi:hypothetical protein